jgi:hypothetical integral membrane protein (TIGR02206 family)
VHLFGIIHVSLILAITVTAVVLVFVCRRSTLSHRPVRLVLGYSLAVNELIWWIFRYSREGFRFPMNLPLQLCDITVWSTVLACVTLAPILVEFSYFAGLAGAGMAVLTPDLWSPWPSYAALYFFLAHGGVVVAVAVLVFGRIARLRPGAVRRAFGLLLIYVAFVGAFNAIFGTNYMYLCSKPKQASLLTILGPWPVYLVIGAAIALVLFQLLWLPVRPAAPRGRGSDPIRM